MEIYNQIKQVLLKKENIFVDIIGQEKVKEQLKSAIILNRHVIIVGPPGVGKTTLAKNIAKILPEIEVNYDCQFHCSPKDPVCPLCKKQKSVKTMTVLGKDRFIRIQGSPDLTVEDLIGDIDPLKAMKFGPMSIEAFTPGKIFKANNGILFFDELNRCPEKLQNALLEVLQEGHITIGSYDIDIPAKFVFIGTMNPEDTNTEKLSDVLLDRFDLIYMSYPENLDIEKNILKSSAKNLLHVPEQLKTFMVYFVRMLRESPDLDKKPSVRASIGLFERSQGVAVLKGKGIVDFSDLSEVLISVLAHRISLKSSIKYLKSPSEFLKEEFEKLVKSNIGQEILKKESGDVP